MVILFVFVNRKSFFFFKGLDRFYFGKRLGVWNFSVVIECIFI